MTFLKLGDFMREDICTIPVSDVFEVNDGCPICRMYDMLQTRAVDYITGAAMMEPDVRVVTNKKGFCGTHLYKMVKEKSGLSLALMLQTHIENLGDDLFSKNDKDGKIAADRLSSCFLCEKINWGMERMIETIYITYENDKDFREMFDNQPTFCLPHYSLLLSGVKKSRLKKYSSEFRNSLKKITQNQLNELNSDLLHFCSMFDYRNRDGDWGNSKTAISRTLEFRKGYEQED